MSDIRTAAQAIIDAGPSAPTLGRDPVNTPMINNWVEAIGDTNPVYIDADAARAAGHPGIVAPPAMAQVWTMRGLNGQRTADDPLGRASELFDEAGYTSVVATNCDTTYHRYLDVGEQVSLSAELVDVVGPKQTALGEGWFFTTRNTWSVDDEVVAEMDFRILKFRPHDDDVAPRDAGAGEVPSDLDPSRMLRPSASRDTEFFWEGVAAHELRIQKLDDGTLRHPPIPATWKPRLPDGTAPVTDYVVASGTGTVSAMWCTAHPRCPGAHCLSWSPSSNSTDSNRSTAVTATTTVCRCLLPSDCSPSCATSTPPTCTSGSASRRCSSTFPPTRSRAPTPGRCTRGARPHRRRSDDQCDPHCRSRNNVAAIDNRRDADVHRIDSAGNP